MEPPWKSLKVIMFLLPFFFDIFLSLFLSVYMETCIYIYIYIVVLAMVYYWILLGGIGIGAIVFAYVNCTLQPFLATHTVAQPPILRHDIHNQKPTYHRIATNFWAWDPLPKTKSQTQIQGYKITNIFRLTKIHKQNPHFLINAFKISDHKHKSQLNHHQDLSWRWKRGDELYPIDFEIMDATVTSWSWPY